jgi:hypothetical protein
MSVLLRRPGDLLCQNPQEGRPDLSPDLHHTYSKVRFTKFYDRKTTPPISFTDQVEVAPTIETVGQVGPLLYCRRGDSPGNEERRA